MLGRGNGIRTKEGPNSCPAHPRPAGRHNEHPAHEARFAAAVPTCVYTCSVPALETRELVSLWRLARLYAAELQVLGGIRLARWLSLPVVLISIALLLSQEGGQDATRRVLGETLAWLSWLVGGVAVLSSLRAWGRFQEPISLLASERGVPAPIQGQAARLGLLMRLFSLLALPAAAVAGVTVLLSSDVELALLRLTWMVLLPLYCLLLAFGLSLLAHWCASLSQHSAATWLLALVFGPHLLRELWPETPSVISVYAGLLKELLLLGGAA